MSHRALRYLIQRSDERERLVEDVGVHDTSSMCMTEHLLAEELHDDLHRSRQRMRGALEHSVGWEAWQPERAPVAGGVEGRARAG